MKTIIRYLKYGSIPSIFINFMWHMCSSTQCEMWERIAGWMFVWLFVSAAIYTFSGVRKKVQPLLSTKFNPILIKTPFSK